MQKLLGNVLWDTVGRYLTMDFALVWQSLAQTNLFQMSTLQKKRKPDKNYHQLVT